MTTYISKTVVRPVKSGADPNMLSCKLLWYKRMHKQLSNGKRYNIKKDTLFGMIYAIFSLIKLN